MGGSGGQTSTTSPPQIPPFLLPILGQEATSYLQGMQNLPQIQQLYGSVPQLGVPPLTAGQQGDIGQIQGLTGTKGAFPYEQQAAQTMGQIASPQAEQQAFQQFALPETMQNAALMGQGTSGAADYAVAQAAIPYQLQAQNTELAAAQGQAGLGQQQVQNQMQQLTTALQAQGLQYDVAQQMAQSLFNQQQQKWGLAKDVQTNPFQLFGSTLGGGTNTISTGSKF